MSASIDILIVLGPDTRGSSEASFDAEADNFCYKSGKVNYNSMVDADAIGRNGWCVDIIDAGLLKIGWPCLDAKYNYWNDPTGPSGYGPGCGEALLFCGKPVSFEPWLYVSHEFVLLDQTGYFGFTIKTAKGVNAISTPIQLSNGFGTTLGLDGQGNPIRRVVASSRTWADIMANSGLTSNDIKYQIKWNGSLQRWEWLNNADPICPLDAYYVYFKSNCEKLILFADGDGQSMPKKQLYAGWNLIGPNPLFPLYGMDANSVLVSVDQTPNGLPGWVQAISPQVKNQDAWVFTPNMKCDVPFMKSGHGYWVYMLNGSCLIGYGFTPLPDKLREIED